MTYSLLSDICDVSYLFISVTYLICELKKTFDFLDSFFRDVCVTWLSYIVTPLGHVCDMIQSYIYDFTLVHVWYDTIICVSCLQYLCDVTQL